MFNVQIFAKLVTKVPSAYYLRYTQKVQLPLVQAASAGRTGHSFYCVH